MRNDRGMKKWMPYASLVEQAEFINKMTIEKQKSEKPFLMDDEENKINTILSEKPCKTHIFLIYDDGFIYKIETKIKTIDLNNRTIVFKNGLKIDITNLVGIED